MDAKGSAGFYKVRYTPGADHRLRGGTSRIYTGTSHPLPFYQGDFPVSSGQLFSQGISSLTGADDNGIVFRHNTWLLRNRKLRNNYTIDLMIFSTER